MSHLRFAIGFLFAFAVVMAGDQAHLALAAPAVPWRAAGPEWVLQEAPHPDCGPGRLKVEVEGTGQASHLGRYTILRQHCFNLATFTIEDGSFVQTAANGDELWGTYTGSTEAVLEFAPDGSPLVIVIASPTQITGGTGRFAHASGAGHTRGVFNVVTKVGTFTFSGEITYQAAEGAGQ
jgi:hypothetical protein